ncbi:MAG: septum formation initiator family protein [Limnochordaceae bacterium]|uniref:Septum formation initiator family protein n=1 Tax=Carboxydichorda subterranea TaxID=3109565 RepID=A0ABZ1BWX9_9FIRM|nr:septum formation initiator family protein [Limnochorda sp. L945t]MBE3599536.1 septum formation initiator family protein [Limnochordaceae bacterium]WRP17011.1 septum formation initiator family protein [Limnochorda sp. L945t]
MVFHFRGRRYRLGRKLWVRAGVLVALMGIASFAGAAYRTYEMHRRLDRLQAAIAAQRSSNARLEKALREASQPAAVESRARVMLGLVKPGEQVFEPAVVVPPGDPYRVDKR